jgi:hypothetical protein
MARAIREREDAIAQRARDLAEAAVRTGATWVRAFGPPPNRPVVAEAWWERLSVVAAYRDRWSITAAGALGDTADIGSLAQAAHRNRARLAGQQATQLFGLMPQVPAAGHNGPAVGDDARIDL